DRSVPPCSAHGPHGPTLPTLQQMKYRFGVFSFDDRTLALTKADRPAPLEPQPARALALLVARAGEVITRDEMRAHLWDAATHVDFDRGIAYCIGELRAALGDSADNPRFVQTLPRRGFTFIAPVTRAPAPQTSDTLAVPHTPPAEIRDPALDAAQARPVVVKPWIAGAAIAGVALIIGAAGAMMVA